MSVKCAQWVMVCSMMWHFISFNRKCCMGMAPTLTWHEWLGSLLSEPNAKEQLDTVTPSVPGQVPHLFPIDSWVRIQHILCYQSCYMLVQSSLRWHSLSLINTQFHFVIFSGVHFLPRVLKRARRVDVMYCKLKINLKQSHTFVPMCTHIAV